MAESVAKTQKVPTHSERHPAGEEGLPIDQEIEDSATDKDKLLAVKAAIAELVGPAEEEEPEQQVEAKPKALTKNEKRKLAKQRAKAAKHQVEEPISDDEDEEEAYVIP